MPLTKRKDQYNFVEHAYKNLTACCALSHIRAQNSTPIEEIQAIIDKCKREQDYNWLGTPLWVVKECSLWFVLLVKKNLKKKSKKLVLNILLPLEEELVMVVEKINFTFTK